MNSHQTSFLRALAVRISAHAARVLPRGRTAWAQAMTREILHIPTDVAAFKWACGCLFASYAERTRAATYSMPRVSRWVLAVEMLCCFTPLTLLFVAVIAYFTKFQTLEFLLYLSGAALGPFGVIVAFKNIALNRPALSKSATLLLAMLAIWTPVANILHTFAERGTLMGWWRETTMIAFLPALAAIHLILLAHAKPQTGATMASE
jgi:hypothetical protein